MSDYSLRLLDLSLRKINVEGQPYPGVGKRRPRPCDAQFKKIGEAFYEFEKIRERLWDTDQSLPRYGPAPSGFTWETVIQDYKKSIEFLWNQQQKPARNRGDPQYKSYSEIYPAYRESGAKLAVPRKFKR